MQLKQNLELKHHCEDFQPVREILREIGAVKEVVKKQKDYFFDLPVVKKKSNGRMKLRVEGRKMALIYYERPDFSAGKEVVAAVSFLEANLQTLEFLGTSLGIIAVVEKKREVWRKDNVVFNLDDVTSIGGIFEIELQKQGKITDKDRSLFSSYQKTLLPYLGNIVKGSNVDLVIKATKTK